MTTIDGIPVRGRFIDLGILMSRIIAELYVASDVASAGFDKEPVTGSKEPPEPRFQAPGFTVRPMDGSEPRASHGWRWYERRFNRATEADERRQLVRDALDELTSLRIAQRLAVDMQTEEGRLAIGRDPRPRYVVAAQYGYTVKHVHQLRRQAAAHDERVRELREHELYDGTLMARTMIAAEPGSAREVAERWNVSHNTVARWRREQSRLEREAWERADGETQDWHTDEDLRPLDHERKEEV